MSFHSSTVQVNCLSSTRFYMIRSSGPRLCAFRVYSVFSTEQQFFYSEVLNFSPVPEIS